MLTWVRRLIVSVGIGGASFAIMLGIVVCPFSTTVGCERG